MSPVSPIDPTQTAPNDEDNYCVFTTSVTNGHSLEPERPPHRIIPPVSQKLVWKLSGLGCATCRTNGKHDDEDDGNLRVMDYNLQALATGSPASPLALAPMLENPPHQPTVESVLAEYIATCRFYGAAVNAGVLTSLRFALPCLRTSDHFHDTDMLALSEILLRHANGPLRYIKRLDFSISGKQVTRDGTRGFKSHGAVALAKVLQVAEYLSEVRLQRNSVGPYGATAIFLALRHNKSIQFLGMRRCRVGERGAFVLAQVLQETENDRALREIDLSANYIGHYGCERVEQALKKLNQNIVRTEDLLTVDLEGNLVFQEVMSAVTHGLGVLLAFVGSFAMSQRVADKSHLHVVSCGVYSASLVVLYTSSTLYHSFFTMQHTKYIFEVLDKCAIYILIAGSYTPFLQIILGHEPLWSVGLLSFIWICGIMGILVEAFCPLWRYRNFFSLAMYLGMGWAALVCLPEASALLPDNAIRLVVLGGVAYSSGVPFFVRSKNMDHAIWHVFVLLGSFFHWLGIYWFVTVYEAPETVAAVPRY